MPERENFDLIWIRDDAVVDVVANAREVHATHTWQRNVLGTCADFRLDLDE